MKIHARNQGGSLASFAAVGVVLAILLIGGLYVVQRYTNPSDQSKEVATNSQNSDDKNTSSSSSSEDKNTSTNSSSSSTNSSEDKNTTSNESSSSSSSKKNSQLPTTGPTSTVVRMLAVAALTFAGVAYARSRQVSLDL